MSTEPRIPAWKKLGLSLKNAKDTAPELPSPAPKRSRDEADTPKGSKKQRLDQAAPNVSSPAPKQSQSVSVASVSSPMPSRLRASPEKSILATPNGKQGGHRKSVAFSNDTKTQDGDSAQTYFQAWANDELEYYAQKAAAYDAAEAAKAEEAKNAENKQSEEAQKTDATPKKSKKEVKAEKKEAKEEKKKAKADKKAEKAEKKEAKESKQKETKESKQEEEEAKEEPKIKKGSATDKAKKANETANEDEQQAAEPSAEKKPKVRTPKTGDKPVPDYVRYLETYHADRSSWKFNKSKQNDLLKNIWNVYRVPPTCNEALAEYLNGLQGAGARQRLRQAAQSATIDIVSFIRTEIPEVKDEPMETPEARRKAYLEALRMQADIKRRNGIDPDPERTKRLQEKKDEDERVQVVWTAMTKDEPGLAARSAPVKAEPKVETARAKRKKRKSRTAESSDDSSSDSNSDSDDDKPAPKKAKIAKKAADSDSDSSSSEDSSSDSDSDSSSSSDSSSEDESSSSEESSSEESDSDSDSDSD